MITFWVALIICGALVIDGTRTYHYQQDVNSLKQVTFAGILFVLEVIAFIFERGI